jgi:hypothetical protein
MVQRYAMVWVLLLLTAPAWSGSWSDDFEDAASVDWEEAGEPNNWTESDGFLNGELVEVDSRAFRLTGDEDWEDYTLTVSANVQNLAGGDWMGVVFRYQSEESYAWFGLSVAWTTFAAGVSGNTLVEQQMKVGFRQWYTLRVEVKGPLVDMYLDDELLLQFDGGAPLSGRVGVFASRSLPQFDDFRVSGDGIADGGPGFAVSAVGKAAVAWADVKARE